MLTDFRYALRMLIKSPAFSAIAILTLGLAIGANSAIFSVVNAVLLCPLPYAHSEQLVRVFGSQPQLDLAPTSPANFLEWKGQNEVFERIGTYTGQGLNLVGGDKPERVVGQRVSADLFQLLGVQPSLGRTFTNEEDEIGHNPPSLSLLATSPRDARPGSIPWRPSPAAKLLWELSLQ